MAMTAATSSRVTDSSKPVILTSAIFTGLVILTSVPVRAALSASASLSALATLSSPETSSIVAPVTAFRDAEVL